MARSQETVAELLVSLGLDTGQFDKSLQEVNRSTKQMETAFNQAKKALNLSEKGIDDYSKAIKAGQDTLESYNKKMVALEEAHKEQRENIKKLKEEYDSLPQKIEEAKKKLDEMKASGNTTAEELEKQSKVIQSLEAKYKNFGTSMSNAEAKAKGLENQMASLKNKITYTENDVESLNKELRQIDEGFNIDKINKGFKDASESAEKLKDKIDGIKDGADKLSGAGAVAVGGMTGAFIEGDNAVTHFKNALGATTEEAEKLKDMAREISNDGFSFEDSVETLKELKLAFGDTFNEQQLEDFTKGIVTINSTFGTDTKEVVKTAMSLIKQFGISGEEAFDLIADGFQSGLDFSGEFLDTLNEYGVQFKEAGFSADEFLAILKKGTKDGVFQLDYLADGIKELGINLQEVGDSQAKALEGIGLSAKEVTDAVNKGGDSAKEATLKVVQALSGMEDKTKQNEYAVALFGTKWEDVGSTLLTTLGDYGSELVNVDGTMKEMSDNVEDGVSGQMLGAWNELKTALEPFGEKVLVPILEKATELVEKFTEWFSNLSDSEQDWIAWGAVAVACISPLLGMASTLIGLFGGVTGAIGGAITKMGGMSGTFSSLAGLMSNPYVLIGALVALAGAIGENEGLILKLQEKFEGLGTVVGGVCEFISGVLQLNFGSVINGIMLLFDLVAAMLDGAGGDTMQQAWERYEARQLLTVEEGMSKIALSTTRGMQHLRNLQDTELTMMNQSLDLAMQQVPLIMDGKYQEASTALANSLTTMNSNQLLALTNMNDTTRYMFDGIKAGMSVDEIIPILNTNFEQIKNSGRLNTEEMASSISSAMETVRSQMDVKTSEGAGAVSTNMANAQSAINNATAGMAIDASSGMSSVASSMIDESGKIAPEVEKNLKTSTTLITKSMDDMKNASVTAMTEMSTQSKSKLDEIISKSQDLVKAFSSAQSRIGSYVSNIANSVSSARSRIISDWNSVIGTLNRSVSGSVTINRTIRTNEAKALVAPLDAMASVASMQSLTRDMVYGGRMYQPSTVASTSSIKAESNNVEMINELKNQNTLLMQMLEVLMAERTVQVDNTITLDGRAIAKGTAKFMEKEISGINKRTNRIAGFSY